MAHKFTRILKKQLQLAAPLIMVWGVIAGSLPVHAAGPTVSITSPVANSVQQGTITIQATAGTGTTGVQFKINGVNLGAEDLIAPFTATWDTRFSPKKDGTSDTTLNTPVEYSITATARSSGGTTNSAAVKVKLTNAALAGTHIVVGDSVTQQAFDPEADGGDPAYTANAPLPAAYRKVFARMGWKVPNVQQDVTNHFIFRWPQKMVVAMGLNDASPILGGDGWTNTDLENFRTLINTVHPTSCVVMVLPGYGPGIDQYYPGWKAEIEKARTAISDLAKTRPRTFTIDWQQVIAQHPEYVDEDGIHLPTPGKTPADDMAMAAQGKLNPVDLVAATARQNFYWKGAAQCDTPSATFQTPAANATVQGNMPVSLATTGAPSVQLQIDGQNIGSPIAQAPYQLDWDTTTMPDGSATANGNHTITAISTNPSGTHTASVTVNVQNPTPVEVVGEDGARVEGILPVQANVTGTASVQFQIDGQNIGSPIAQAPYQLDWDTTTMPDGSATANGNHTITAISTRPSGSTHTASKTVSVQNPPIPGSVGIVGDSVTYNAFNSGGVWYEQTFFGNKPQNLVHSYWPGHQHTNTQADVVKWATNRTPQILIDAMGINDARPYDSFWKSGDGFTNTDRTNALAALNTPHPTSCKVLVLPGWGTGLTSTAYGVLWAAELQKVRDFYTQLAAERSDIVLADWQTIVNTHPEYMNTDGIHLAPKAGGANGWRADAAEARQTLYWDGVAACQARIASR